MHRRKTAGGEQHQRAAGGFQAVFGLGERGGFGRGGGDFPQGVAADGVAVETRLRHGLDGAVMLGGGAVKRVA